MKKIAMIPMLLRSTRVPDKNLLYVDGHLLVSYVVRACQQAEIFDEIYLNSEHLVFSKIAEMLGVQFYHRKPENGGSACEMTNKSRQCSKDRCQTHDHFLFDFMRNFEPCHLALVHTTSPLLKPATIKNFVSTLEKQNYDSLFSVEERYAETLLGNQPFNFSFSKKIPTQTLPPLRTISWALSGWKTSSFMESYLRNDPNENGPTFCGKVGYFNMDRIEALDGDTWDDIRLIEASLQYQRQQVKAGAFRYSENVTAVEYELRDLISHDGVVKYEDKGSNVRLSNLDEIKKKMGKAPWLYLLVYAGTDQTALICQQPGEGARKHCHVTHDEWWVVLEGSFEWRLIDGSAVKANAKDVVFLPRGTVHSIVCTGDAPGIRLACGGRYMEHIYVR
ncbi:MAG: hypothetical protein A3H42_01675 [Deltaproteobacteria bacterium RIFCSPLOWO2_02_FULL_46_8]|nr:MAG: hypothetical protein A3H42_01675 [Deltaproteobacteria bacterium RIFCSPLOWO2_02_FULL_46_8]